VTSTAPQTAPGVAPKGLKIGAIRLLASGYAQDPE
jgi:hypothetical protein